MSRKAPPPASPAPFNMDEVEIVRRKVAPPAGPPPAGMAAFKAPRMVEAVSDRDRDRNRDLEPRGRPKAPSPDYRDRRSPSPDYRDRRSPSPDYRGRTRSRSRSNSPERGYARRYPSRSPSPDDRDRDLCRRRNSSPDYIEETGKRGRREDSNMPNENDRASPKYDKPSPKDFAKSTEDSKDLAGAKGSTSEQEHIFNFNVLMRTTYRELRAFILSPPPERTVVRCYIERSASGSNMFNPVYSLCADLDDGTGRELICCRKVTSLSAHYVFSLKSDDLYRKRDQRSRLYLGKLRATSPNEYVLYDGGSCDMPEGAGSDLLETEQDDEISRHLVEDSLYRSQLVVIHFNDKKRPCAADERGMEVCIPHPSLVIAPATAAEGSTSKKILVDIINPFAKIRAEGTQNEQYRHKILVFHERVSRYDALSSCLVDFKGRASIASVKNFQLIKSEPMLHKHTGPPPMAGADPRSIHLQMGKITKDAFNMDFRGPMSMLQCFAVCIARFDANLSWS